jgi:hypothetical protein
MKGQTAVEYLMTYGWAILIILIVAGVLAYYGIFAPAGFLAPTARGFGQIQVLNPWSVSSSDGTIQMNIQNRVGGEITLTGADVTIGTSNATYTATDTPVLASGKDGIVEFTTTSWPITANAGDSYTATVTILYTYSGSTFSSTGTLSGTYG